ncbi:MAG: hypothetical protein WD029_10990 [Microthrixaceae bacterium]
MIRTEALTWAANIRSARYRLRADLASGQLALGDVLQFAKQNEATGLIKLLWTLESLPGARKVATRRQLAELGLAEGMRLGDLDQTATRTILDKFAAQAESHVSS